MSKWSRRSLVLAATGWGCWLGMRAAGAQDAKQSSPQAAKQTSPQPAKQPSPEPAPPTTIAVDAKLVTLAAVVHRKKGALVQTLTKDDFALQVDGHAQTIRYFDQDTKLPLTLGLLVDTSRSVASKLEEERSASSAFLDGMLGTEKDRAFVVQFARQTELLQDLTNSRPKLQAALKELDTPSPGGGTGTGSDPEDSGDSAGNRGRRSHGGTALYDAAFLAADELMSKQTGRKALVLLTDGEDRGSKESLASAIEAAQRADTVVYAIYFKGQEQPDNRGGSPGGGGRRGGIGFPGGGGGGGYPGGGGGSRGGGGGGRSPEPRVAGKKILERISGETGGRVFEISKKETVAVIYDQIAQELRAGYRLGFTPNKDTAAEVYHQIDLSLPRSKDLSVQTRDGYYTGK